jgi:N-acetyl-anhydromuramyl-L-alanine amidase AmpD
VRIGADGWLTDGSDARRMPTRRTCAMVPGGPRATLWHWTGGYGSTRALARLYAEGSGPSFHFGIDRSGDVTQLAPVTVGTHHCRGRWVAGQCPDGLAGRHVNESSIGIELVGIGEVAKVGTVWCQVENPHEPPAKRRVSDGIRCVPMDVIEHDGRHYQRFHDRQIAAAALLIRAITDRFGVLPHYGHRDLDPTRKADPGPDWMRRGLPLAIEAAGGPR